MAPMKAMKAMKATTVLKKPAINKAERDEEVEKVVEVIMKVTVKTKSTTHLYSHGISWTWQLQRLQIRRRIRMVAAGTSRLALESTTRMSL